MTAHRPPGDRPPVEPRSTSVASGTVGADRHGDCVAIDVNGAAEPSPTTCLAPRLVRVQFGSVLTKQNGRATSSRSGGTAVSFCMRVASQTQQAAPLLDGEAFAGRTTRWDASNGRAAGALA